MTNKKEESYQITFLGLLALALDMDSEKAKAVRDQVELYLRRHHMKEPGECGAIIFDGKNFVFTSVMKEG